MGSALDFPSRERVNSPLRKSTEYLVNTAALFILVLIGLAGLIIGPAGGGALMPETG
jgi:hypothetical protein